MALYFYFNETTGDMVYSDQSAYSAEGYTGLGEQADTDPANKIAWIFDSQRANIKTVTKDSSISTPIDVLTSMGYMFTGCEALASLDLSGFDTSNVTNMDGVFNLCSTLVSLDLSGFDTSSVASMNRMFNGCSGLTYLDLSGFDTSSVTSMDGMFSGCQSLASLDLIGFDTSSVTITTNMFDECTALRIIDISPDMSNILSVLPADTYYDASTRQPYAKADIPGGGAYVRDLEDLDLVATMVQTRMGINVAKHLAYKAFEKANAGVLNGPGIKQWLLDNVYRVGYVWISYVDESPADLIGGTWTPITNVFPRFSSATDTGGSDSVTLTVSQMPSHNHAWRGYDLMPNGTGGPRKRLTPGNDLAGYTQSTGGSGAHTNLPKYQGFYAWRRTA